MRDHSEREPHLLWVARSLLRHVADAEKGQKISRNQIVSRLVEILYEHNGMDFRWGAFRVRGDAIEIYPTCDDNACRIELWGGEVERLTQIDPLCAVMSRGDQDRPRLHRWRRIAGHRL